MFSPRARGCSYIPGAKHPAFEVFPACAGMFPAIAVPDSSIRRFPRVRGDVPRGTHLWGWRCRFSPRARGCSREQQRRTWSEHVFPACAGMFLYGNVNVVGGDGFPRVRGDVPFLTSSIMRHTVFSPRARGCSLCLRSHDAPLLVFPACAGMFLKAVCIERTPHGFPRVRGDVPLKSPGP